MQVCTRCGRERTSLVQFTRKPAAEQPQAFALLKRLWTRSAA